MLVGGEVVALLPEDHPGQSELKWSRNAFKPFLIIDPQVGRRGVWLRASEREGGAKQWEWACVEDSDKCCGRSPLCANAACDELAGASRGLHSRGAVALAGQWWCGACTQP